MKRLLLLLFLAGPAVASNIYFDYATHGTNDGTSCVNARAYSSMASGDYAAGNVLHICGTDAVPANTTAITMQGSGSAGNPVILLFEPNAVLTSTYWPTAGGIVCSGKNYIIVDGGGNGLMTATANGTSLANQTNSKGLYFSNCSNIIVQNLTGTNLYQRSSSSDTTSGGNNTNWIFFDTGSDHINVNHNTLSNSRNLIFVAYSTVTDVQIYSNTLDYSSWMITMGDNNTNSHASGVLVHDNTLGPHFNIWLDSAQTMHGDGIDLYVVNAGSTFAASVYNNYIHGDMCQTSGVNCTAYLYIDGGHNGTNVFNNILVHDVSGAGGGPEGNLVIRGEGNTMGAVNVYNNTIGALVAGNSSGIKTDACCGGAVGNQQTFKNNVFFSLSNNYLSGPDSFSQVAAANNNEYFSFTTFAQQNASTGPAHVKTFANWQALDYDAVGSISDPKLNADFTLQAGSAAIGLGANLTSSCSGSVVPLCSDKAGIVRRASGGWASGAYQQHQQLSCNGLRADLAPAATTAFTAGQRIYPVTNNAAANIYEAGNSGTTGGSIPNWGSTCPNYGPCPSLDGTVHWINKGINDCRGDVIVVDVMSAQGASPP